MQHEIERDGHGADVGCGAGALAAKGAYTVLPQAWHTPLEQAHVLTRAGAAVPLAAALLRHLQTPSSRAQMQRFGFELPGAAAAGTR